MKYFLFFILACCKNGESRIVTNIDRNISDTITLKFIDFDDSKIVKNFQCVILTYNEIYPNEEDLKNGIQMFPDSLGFIHIPKKKLSRNFFPKFQVVFNDKNTIGIQRFYYKYNKDDTTYIVNYLSQFRVTYNNEDEKLKGDIMKIHITKFRNDSIIDNIYNEYDYLKYKLSSYSEPVYLRKNETIKVEVTIIKGGNTIKKYDHTLNYVKCAKFELNANTGLLNYFSD